MILAESATGVDGGPAPRCRAHGVVTRPWAATPALAGAALPDAGNEGAEPPEKLFDFAMAGLCGRWRDDLLPEHGVATAERDRCARQGLFDREASVGMPVLASAPVGVMVSNLVVRARSPRAGRHAGIDRRARCLQRTPHA